MFLLHRFFFSDRGKEIADNLQMASDFVERCMHMPRNGIEFAEK
jgi:hypothetical protein